MLGARSFIFAAASSAAALPACGIGTAGIEIGGGPADAGAGLPGDLPDGGGADAPALEATSLPLPDATLIDVAGEAANDAANDAPPEAPVVDAAAGGQVDAPSGAGCDRDGDGWLAVGDGCNGEDCCDTDPNAHPGQTAFFTQADGCGSFDYAAATASTSRRRAA